MTEQVRIPEDWLSQNASGMTLFARKETKCMSLPKNEILMCLYKMHCNDFK